MVWCFLVVVEAGPSWMCGEGVVGGAVLVEALSSNGETVHFESLGIQRHQDAGFALSKIKVTKPRQTN